MCFLMGLLLLAAAVGNEFSLSEALAKIQPQDLPGAVGMLEQITKREPDNDMAWRGLGFAYLKLGKPDQAIPAYLRAHDIDPKLPTPLYYMGLAYALKGDRAEAFAWLTRAKETGRFDMTQIESAPELSAVKSDARFTALLPTRKEFDNPFVEQVKIVREWDGEAANGQFGWLPGISATSMATACLTW
jgi:tetratricopeptide (TPR) repeat protein